MFPFKWLSVFLAMVSGITTVSAQLPSSVELAATDCSGPHCHTNTRTLRRSTRVRSSTRESYTDEADTANEFAETATTTSTTTLPAKPATTATATATVMATVGPTNKTNTFATSASLSVKSATSTTLDSLSSRARASSSTSSSPSTIKSSTTSTSKPSIHLPAIPVIPTPSPHPLPGEAFLTKPHEAWNDNVPFIVHTCKVDALAARSRWRSECQSTLQKFLAKCASRAPSIKRCCDPKKNAKQGWYIDKHCKKWMPRNDDEWVMHTGHHGEPLYDDPKDGLFAGSDSWYNDNPPPEGTKIDPKDQLKGM